MYVLLIRANTSSSPPVEEQAWLIDGDSYPLNMEGNVQSVPKDQVIEIRQHQNRAVNHVNKLKDAFEKRTGAAQKVASS